MKITKRPSRRDLLRVVYELQNIVGRAMVANNDRNPNQWGDTTKALEEAHTLCIDARAFDQPDDGA